MIAKFRGKIYEFFFSLCVFLGVTVSLLREPRWEKRNPGELPSACSEQVNQSGPECVLVTNTGRVRTTLGNRTLTAAHDHLHDC